MPGTYTVRLTVDGETSRQPLVVEMDPRVQATREDLAQQFALSMKVYEWTQRLPEGELRSAAASLLRSLQSADAAPTEQLITAVAELEARIAAPQKSQ